MNDSTSKTNNHTSPGVYRRKAPFCTVPISVFSNPYLGSDEVAVYAFLDQWRQNSYPSQARIKQGLTREAFEDLPAKSPSLPSIRRSINALQNQGYVRMIRRGLNRTNVYVLCEHGSLAEIDEETLRHEVETAESSGFSYTEPSKTAQTADSKESTYQEVQVSTYLDSKEPALLDSKEPAHYLEEIYLEENYLEGNSALTRLVANPKNGFDDDTQTSQTAAIEPAVKPPTETMQQAEQLCTEFADAVVAFSEKHGMSWPEPQFHSKAAIGEMEKLIRLGTTDPDVKGQPVKPDQIRRLIRAMHEQLCQPEGKTNFCWSYVTRSPKKLRKNWEQIRTELNARRKTGGNQQRNKITGLTADETLATAKALVARLNETKQETPQLGAGS